MKSRLLKSRLLIVFGWLTSIGSLASYIGFRIASGGSAETNSILTWGLLLLFVVGVVVATHAFDAGKKLSATNVKRLLSTDPRLPVLYLRSFSADETASQLEEVGDSRLVLPSGTDEEALVAVLNWVGPVIAIGRPDEKLPTRGAARIYVEVDDWQQVIHDWLTSSQLVVLRAGSSDGLLWEFSQAIKDLGPERIVILVPSIEGVYEAFCDSAGSRIPHELPKKPPNVKQAGGLIGFVWFDKDWTPFFERLGRSERLRGKVSMPAYKPLLGLFLPLIRGQLSKSEYSYSSSEILDEYSEISAPERPNMSLAIRWTLYIVLANVLVSAPLDAFQVFQTIGALGVMILSALSLAVAQWIVLSDYLKNAKYWFYMTVAAALLSYVPYLYVPTFLVEWPVMVSVFHGACYGLAQWFVIRHVSKWSWIWIPACTLGWGLGQWLGGFAAQFLFSTSLPFGISMLLVYAISAAVLGFITGMTLVRLIRGTSNVRL